MTTPKPLSKDAVTKPSQTSLDRARRLTPYFSIIRICDADKLQTAEENLINAIAEALTEAKVKPFTLSEEELERECRRIAMPMLRDMVSRTKALEMCREAARFGAGRTMLELLPSEEDVLNGFNEIAKEHITEEEMKGYVPWAVGMLACYRFIRSKLGGG